MSVCAQINDSLRRVVKMEGAFNFRDAGGYKTADGKEVVLGKIYRSDAIDKLSDRDLKTFKNKKISTVVDFRGVEEAKKLRTGFRIIQAICFALQEAMICLMHKALQTC